MERKRALNKALRNNRIEIVGFYRFCSPRKSHAWRIKKEGGEGKMGGKTDTKHGDIAIFNSRPSMSLYEQGRTWRQRVYESCIHTNSTFSGCCFPGFACVCVCVCARLLLSLHHDFEYAWLDVLPRRCCSKNSTIIFSISAEARFLFSFFFHRFVVAMMHDVNIDGWKEREVVQHRSNPRPPRWDTSCMAQFRVLCSDSSSRRTTCWWILRDRLIFLSWKICI